MRTLLFSVAIAIGIYEAILFLKFSTFKPCEALTTEVGRVHEQARSELGLPSRIVVNASVQAVEQLHHSMQQAIGIPDPNTLFHCEFALGKIAVDYRGAVERAKSMWKTEADRVAQERVDKGE